MKTIASFVLAAWLSSASAEAQPPTPAGSVDPMPAPSTPAVPVAIRDEAQELANLTRLYEKAQRAVGGEHVMLTATAYIGKQHPRRDKLALGAAGLVTLPLVGIGGGHGVDWYPVLATDSATDAFRRFEAELAQYTTLLEGVSANRQSEPYDVLLEAAKLLAREVDDADPAVWKPVRALRMCLDDLTELEERSKVGPQRNAEDVAHAESFVRWYEHHGESTLQRLHASCIALLALPRDATQSLQSLKALVASYLDTARESARDLQRHHVLLGPSLGFPLVDNPTDWFLLGALLEVGGGKFVRFAASGGLQMSYRDPGRTPGWFAGLALSGELGDDLFHLLNGGLWAARAVTAEP